MGLFKLLSSTKTVDPESKKQKQLKINSNDGGVIPLKSCNAPENIANGLNQLQLDNVPNHEEELHNALDNELHIELDNSIQDMPIGT